LIGIDNFNKINNKTVMVIGVGGVGGFVVEGLARAGVGNFILIDGDVVSVSNINRQIIALNSTIGKRKVDVIKERILDINPYAVVENRFEFLNAESVENMKISADYVIDAVDNVSVKIALAVKKEKEGFNLISCMGTGNKISSDSFEICDIYSTINCPLAKAIRKNLKRFNVKNLDVLFSKEEVIKTNERTPKSISYVPSIAGLKISEFVIRKFLESEN